MKLAWLMIAVSVLSAAILNAILGSGVTREVWLGMGGPVAIASLEWIAVERRHRKAPERLTSLMLSVFVGKMVFFALFISAILGTDLVRPIPFVACFVSFFLALMTVEAVALHRMTTIEPGARQADLN